MISLYLYIFPLSSQNGTLYILSSDDTAYGTLNKESEDEDNKFPETVENAGLSNKPNTTRPRVMRQTANAFDNKVVKKRISRNSVLAWKTSQTSPSKYAQVSKFQSKNYDAGVKTVLKSSSDIKLEPKDWNSAKQACKEENKELFFPKSVEEFEFIAREFNLTENSKLYSMPFGLYFSYNSLCT